ncbi:MAG: hypothetical protein M3529_14445 [Actinomycetota bacterium]|nr:hypothetical protein [Actinomycetota bacterium]
MEQLDCSLDDAEPRDGLSLRRQLLSCLSLEGEALSVDGVEFDLECGQVDVGSGLGFGRVGLVPPGSGFGEACWAAGGRVGGHLQQRGRGLFGRPATAADGEV